TAGVSPLLLGRGNIPLYLGHRVRFATPAQRQVLETLYPTCAVQGCEVPGTLCEVDHVNGWALNGSPTDIDQLALCCGWHNRHKHTNPDQIHITKGPNGRYTYRLVPPDYHRRRPPGEQRSLITPTRPATSAENTDDQVIADTNSSATTPWDDVPAPSAPEATPHRVTPRPVPRRRPRPIRAERPTRGQRHTAAP
ncbi:HNH endonuclease signature motif containing protein, partial [Actinomadura fibrosa]